MQRQCCYRSSDCDRIPGEEQTTPEALLTFDLLHPPVLCGRDGGRISDCDGVYDKPLLAINIGASAPLILQTLAKGLRR
jgi:hypothetical protein